MLSLFFALFLAFLSILSVVLQKAYTHTSLKALKHQARVGDTMAASLYRPAAYGEDLQLLFWLIIVVSTAGSAILLKSTLSTWLALLLIVLLLWLSFIWLPSIHISTSSKYLAKWLASPLSWALHYLHPLLKRLNHFAGRFYSFNPHSSVYDKNDLIDLINWQKDQPDNHIPYDDLTAAAGALSFGNKLVSSVLVPERMVHSISANATITPVLIDELHQTGHKCFPVYEGKSTNIVGTLYLSDLINNAKKGGLANTIMHRRVFYIHEDDSLHQVLKAFYKTKHHLFIVVNEFEEFIGIITIEDILTQIIGKPLVDEFDQYDNVRAVATRLASKEHTDHQKPDAEIKEVIE